MLKVQVRVHGATHHVPHALGPVQWGIAPFQAKQLSAPFTSSPSALWNRKMKAIPLSYLIPPM